MADRAIQRQFLTALEDGDLARVRELISLGADVNLPANDPDGQTPLIRAVAGSNAEAVRLLLAAGAKVNQPENHRARRTPLMFAHTQPEILRDLLAAGAEVNARSAVSFRVSPIDGTRKRRGGETALHLAAGANHAEAVRILVAAGADVEAKSEEGLGPLDVALRLGRATDTAAALVEAGAAMTPERLALMHTSVHSPDSDVWQFPWITDRPSQSLPPPPPGAAPDLEPTPDSAAEPRCPKCSARLFSRRSLVCGNCGAPLPPELVVNDEQAQARREERAWARRLANAFTTGRPTTDSIVYDRHLADNGPQTLPARSLSFAEEFRRRPRPDFWIYLLGYFLLGVTLSVLAWYTDSFPFSAVLISVGILIALALRSWVQASPICPHCHQNIRYCAFEYCLVCGQPLRGNRCPGCSVDQAWTGWLFPLRNSGNRAFIRFCPGCGVELDSWVRRWQYR